MTTTKYPTLTEAKLEQFLAGMRNAEYVAIDTETTGEEYDIRSGAGYAIGISIAFRPIPNASIVSHYFPIRHFDWNYSPQVLSQLKEVIESQESTLLFHNAKHDLVSLETVGIHAEGHYYDTMLMAHLLDENEPSKALDYLARKYLGDTKQRSAILQAAINAVGWKMLPANMVREYAEHDAVLCLRLFEEFISQWHAEELDKDWFYRAAFVRTIARMEQQGVRIDVDLCKREIAKGEFKMQEITEAIGKNPGSSNDLKDLLIHELKLPVVKFTPKGAPSFNKEAMTEYEAMLAASDNPTASLILEYRGWQKTVSSNYRAYLKLIGHDGRLRPNYKLHGTRTGRLSCETPNLQQIPRVSDKPWNGALKKAFIPTEGYKLWEFDYAQLELRLGAAYAKDPTLKHIFASPERDVFTEMASQLGMARQDVKTLVYTIQFGGGVNRVATVFKIPDYRAKSLIDNFYETYPGFRQVSSRATSVARSKGHAKLWSGRRRHFSKIEREDKPYKAFNAVIQGGAADIVMHTILRLDEFLDYGKDDACRMLLQIHDAVVFEIKDGREDDYLPQIKAIMEDVKPDFGVRFKVSHNVWGEK